MAEFLTSENLIEMDDLSKTLYNNQSTCLSHKLTVSTKKGAKCCHVCIGNSIICSDFEISRVVFIILKLKKLLRVVV